jgi:excisionase family DNA binding protein
MYYFLYQLVHENRRALYQGRRGKAADTGESILAQIMTTKEMAKYLRLHQITICKLSKEGKIPGIQIGRVWRFDKERIDDWIAKG